jgi:predicted Zn-dependent protease
MHAQFRVYAEDGWSTGYQEQFGETITERDVLTGIDIAIEKCNAWRNPIETKPGRQTTVFEPRALADMLKPLLGQFSSRAIEDGQSFLRKLDGSSFAGSKLFHESISLRSDPRAPECASLPFTMDGTPVRATSWVRAGVIEQVVLDRYEAAENGSEAVPPPTNLLMEGGESTMEDLIRGTEKGLLVTGFASLSIIDPANCLLTGSTRDGLFMIEDGKITRGVRNTLLRETPVYLLKEVEALGRTERTSTTGSYFPMELPSMRVKDVLFGASSGVV